MGDNQGAGIVGQGRFDQFPRVDRVDRHRALGHHRGVDDAMGGIEENHGQDLVLQPAHRVEEILGHLAGAVQVLFADDPLAEVAPGHPLDELDGKYIFRSDPFDLLQLHGRGIEDPGQGLELGERRARRLFAVGTGGTEGEQKLEDLAVGKGLNPLMQKLVAEPLSMALSFLLPLALFHVRPL